MKLTKKPYISFVVVGRNDNYAEGYLYRLQHLIDSLTDSCEKFGLDSELIIVEWNPPKENPSLESVLKIPRSRKHLSIRIIGVPKKIHNTLKNSEKIHFFEFIGKNVGISRAKGDFVLITNSDIIFEPKLIEFLSKKRLNKKTYYRINRYDLSREIPSKINSPSKIENFCNNNWKLNWSPRWGRYHKRLSFKDLIRIPIRTFLKYFNKFSYLRYHGGAPGDFMLLSKKGWERVRGFPEGAVQRGLLDGYTSIQIIADGNKFKILDGFKTFHQYHPISPPCSGKQEYVMYIKDARKMLKDKQPIINNPSSWGLKNFKLPEKIIN